MSQNLILGLPTPVALALLALALILLAVASVLVTLRKPAPVRMPGQYGEAPYKIETPERSLHVGRIDVVPQAGRAPANR
jgi:hypothetical protein